MNEPSNSKMNDLVVPMLERIQRDGFYGEIILKCEAGAVMLVKIHSSHKRDGMKKFLA